MPIYEYICEQCGVLFERLCGMDEAALQDCPECGGPGNKVLSIPAHISVQNDLETSTSRRDNCAHDSPCCGRQERCQTPPCESR